MSGLRGRLRGGGGTCLARLGGQVAGDGGVIAGGGYNFVEVCLLAIDINPG